MGVLSSITSPKDLANLSTDQIKALAEEIREFLVRSVSQTGGHLGPNLGVVELTIALHRIFDSPTDTIVFDTGHQSYVHKILTGRQDFGSLRQEGGISGYPSRLESDHDVVENSHASTSLSWASGIARGYALKGQNRRVVAVIGDGALTGGMAWEALNNIAEDPHLPLVIVVNDNGRSYAPTVGGMIRRINQVRVTRNYENLLNWGKRTLVSSGKPGKMAYDALHGLKQGVKDVFVDGGIFDSLGLKYIGPVDGHDVDALEEALELANDFGGPVVVHAITEKGRGYEPALADIHDRFHAVGKIHPETGLPIAPARFGWTAVFAEEIVKLARDDESIVGMTAAMLLPVGLGPLADEFPHRVFDTGIAEQHAVTAAAGLAFAGFHPVVALYATFLNRAFDQLLMDVALHDEPVTIVLDRAGITGDDGASHNGMWDLSLAAMIPNLRTAAPRDGATLRAELAEAVSMQHPTLLRYPKGDVPTDIPAIDSVSGLDVIGRVESADSPRILIVAIGAMASNAIAALDLVEGADLTVVDPRWVLPIGDNVVEYAQGFDAVVTVEDGLRDGGVGEQIEDALDIPVHVIGVGRHFLNTAKRDVILEREGMTPAGIAEAAKKLADAVRS